MTFTKKCLYQSFFKSVLEAFTRVLQVTINVKSVLQTQRLILKEQIAYAMKGSTRNLDYMELLAKVIASPEFYNCYLLFIQNNSPFLIGSNPPAFSP